MDSFSPGNASVHIKLNGDMELEKIDKLKLVMWDLDGTIVDSRRQHHEASKEVLKQHGFAFHHFGQGITKWAPVVAKRS